MRQISTIAIFVLTFTAIICGQGNKRYYNLGIQAQADQNFEKAVEYFEKSLKYEGQTPECLNNLGQSLQQISRKYANEAYKRYMKALKLSPKNEVTLSQLGELYLWQNNILKSKEILNKLQKLESEDAEILKEKIDRIIYQLSKIR